MPTDRRPPLRDLTRADWICWALYALGVMLWLHGYYTLELATRRSEVTVAVIFLVGALVLSALKPPLRIELTQEKTQ